MRVLLVLEDVLAGKFHSYRRGGDPSSYLREVHRVLRHLYGKSRLASGFTNDELRDLDTFAHECPAVEFMDFLEALFKADGLSHFLEEDQLISAFNEVFRSEGATYRMTAIVRVSEPASASNDLTDMFRVLVTAGTVVRIVEYPKIILIEDEVVYTEALVPALAALAAPDMAGANSEFRKALEDFKRGEFSDCLTKCGSCFESVLKVICSRKAWPFKSNDTAKPLLELVIGRAQIESFFTQPLLLVATMRNRLGSAHGGGSSQRLASEFEAQYCVTATAAAVIFLVKAAERDNQ